VQPLALVVVASKNLKAAVQRQKQLSAISTQLQSALALLNVLPKSAVPLESVAHVTVTESNG
jgi:hypothetical protein